MAADVKLSLPQRSYLKRMLHDRCRDWAGFHAALKAAHGLTISQSSIDRFIAGGSNSARTFRTFALVLGTTPDALAGDLRLEPASDALTEYNKPVSPVQASADLAAVAPLRDREAFRVAYQLWFEMSTRKVAQPIDPATDLVVEIYDSWYVFFKNARELAKAIPLHKNPVDPALRRLVQLSHAMLNHGLRPHLQRWQGKFRHWIAAGGDKSQTHGIAPQAAQQLFPEWPALRDDLFATSQRLMTYHAALAEMVAQPNAPHPPARPKPRRKK